MTDNPARRGEECKHGIDGPSCDIHGYGKPTAQEAERACPAQYAGRFCALPIYHDGEHAYQAKKPHETDYKRGFRHGFDAGRAEGERKERLLLDSLDRQDSVHNEELTALRAENARLLDLCVAWEKRHHDRILERDAAEQREKRLREALEEYATALHHEIHPSFAADGVTFSACPGGYVCRGSVCARGGGGEVNIKGTGSREENETVIAFNDADADASVNTASPTVYRRLSKLGYKPLHANENRAWFVVPKRDVRLPRPRKPISEARRAVLTAARSLAKPSIGTETPGKTARGAVRGA